MTFQAFRSLLQVSLVLHLATVLVHPRSFLSSPFFVAFPFDHSSCHKMFHFLSSYGMLKKGCLHLWILFMRDLVVSASQNAVLFDFFAVHEICSILHRNHISVGSSFICGCFEIVQVSHSYIRMGSIWHFRTLLLVCMDVFLFVYTDFII